MIDSSDVPCQRRFVRRSVYPRSFSSWTVSTVSTWCGCFCQPPGIRYAWVMMRRRDMYRSVVFEEGTTLRATGSALVSLPEKGGAQIVEKRADALGVGGVSRSLSSAKPQRLI